MPHDHSVSRMIGEVKVTVDFASGTIADLKDGKSGKGFQPEMMDISFSLCEEGVENERPGWQASWIDVYGPLRVKGGALGSRKGSRLWTILDDEVNPVPGEIMAAVDGALQVVLAGRPVPAAIAGRAAKKTSPAPERSAPSPGERPEAGDPKDVLADGLAWLFDTVQPDGAVISPNGIAMRATDGRTYGFFQGPTLLTSGLMKGQAAGRSGPGGGNFPVVCVEVTDKQYDRDEETNAGPANPLRPDELDSLAEYLTAHGYPVAGMWNGHPAHSGSIALDKPHHPTLQAAFRLYRGGCPNHPAKSVFCTCKAWRAGLDRAVRPEGAL